MEKEIYNKLLLEEKNLDDEIKRLQKDIENSKKLNIRIEQLDFMLRQKRTMELYQEILQKRINELKEYNSL